MKQIAMLLPFTFDCRRMGSVLLSDAKGQGAYGGGASVGKPT
jgi:hypothetical protein